MKASNFKFQVGDHIEFKDDYEQTGIIEKIHDNRDRFGYGHRYLDCGNNPDALGNIGTADYNVYSVQVQGQGEWIELDRL